MVRLSKMTDYALVVMSGIAQSRDRRVRTARDLSGELRLPLPTVSKLLKRLSQTGLLVSQRGINGGYSLAREPQRISLSQIISALEGPVALTECSTGVRGVCELEPCCAIKKNQQLISQAVQGVLEGLTLSDLIQPMYLATVKNARGELVPFVGVVPGRVQ